MQKMMDGFSKKSSDYVNLANLHSLISNENTKIGVSSYANNVIVNRCVNIIAQSAGHVPLKIYKTTPNGKKAICHDALSRLLTKPNHKKIGTMFFEQVIADKLLYGNAYILATGPKGAPPRELYIVSPDSIESITRGNKIIAYKYLDKTYPIDPITGDCQILHLKNYNPTDKNHGISNLSPAAISIALHDKASRWNHSLLSNGARPSGALVAKNDYGISDIEFNRLKEQLDESHSGAYNSGRPILLEGGMEWIEMSISPKDMDFIESKNTAAREIALSFGVPPQLLAIAGDNTYSNMQEARLALWEETLLPILGNLTRALTDWLLPKFGEKDLMIDFDDDAISALAEKRQNLWQKINEADFMTTNEKRAIIGLKPLKKNELSSNCTN